MFTSLVAFAFFAVSCEEESVQTLPERSWELTWSDEFDGDSLNRADWNVETHEKGWVNNELQEYLDSAENIQVKDGKLIINPVKKVTDGDTGSTKEAASYTSGRVSTQNKQTFIYGRFECRAKVPKGHGYLPAFTLS